MGKAISARFKVDKRIELAALIDPAGEEPDILPSLESLPHNFHADLALDFSTVQATRAHAETCLKRGWDLLIGVTGFEESDIARFKNLAEAYQRRIVVVPNFSIGVNLLFKFASQAAKFFTHVEIIEMHHDKKVDAPSGTAVYTARIIGAEKVGSEPPNPEDRSRGKLIEGVPVHAVRLQGLLAHQEVMLGNEGEVLTIRHDTTDRTAFLKGIYLAIENMDKLPPGFKLGLEWIFDIE